MSAPVPSAPSETTPRPPSAEMLEEAPPGAEEHPYAPFLNRVRKPGQYLGGESGERRKPWNAVRGRVCLAFPDLYEVGMSHLGFKILYGVLNDHPELLAERAYAPGLDLEAELRARGQPLRSLESWQPLAAFDVVGFSLQFELTYTNILTMLELAGIPLRSAGRQAEEPLVLAGGPVATHGEPIAPFFDAMLIGDGEVRTVDIACRWVELVEQGVERRERLQRLTQIPGVYVPALYRTSVQPDTGFHVVTEALDESAPLPVERTFVENLDQHPFPTDGPVAATETVFDRVSVEIARGCTEGCRFRQAGMIYRPVRERSPTEVLATIDASVNQGGYDEASLTCLSTADYSAVSPLVKELIARAERDNLSVSVSSLRAYGLSEDVLDAMTKTRAMGLTFAPEAGSQRMRDVVNKNVTEAQLLETADRVFSRGWEKMKLYFMIGLPTEEEADVREIVRTGARAHQVGKQARKRALQQLPDEEQGRHLKKGSRGSGSVRVTVSVSTHVPKPHTPFQWCAMDSYEQILKKQALLREEAHHTRIQLRLHDSKGSWLEGVLARGDRRLADVIETAYRNGARFDSWQEHLKLAAWTQAFELHAVDPELFLGTIPMSARLPWDHIDVGLEEGFLAKEYRKALRNRLSPPCGKAAGMFVHHASVAEAKADARRLVCYDCGIACDMGAMRQERLVALQSIEPQVQAREGDAAKPGEGQQGDATGQRFDRRVRHQKGFARLRLAYCRTGRNAFGSHLDMVRLLPRMFRRAGLPLFYSEGFHPKPVMVFGPSLPVGTASLCEYIDLKLEEGRAGSILDDLAGLLRQLNLVTPDGVAFFGARALGPKDPALGKVIDEVHYVAGLSEQELLSRGMSASELQRQILARLESPRIDLVREVKGIKKRVNLKDFLLAVDVGCGREELQRAGYCGKLTPVSFSLRLTNKGTARATEVVEGLVSEGIGARIVRTQVFGTPKGLRGTPLDLEAFRAPAGAQDQSSAGVPGASRDKASVRVQ